MSEPFAFVGVPAYDSIEPMAIDGISCPTVKLKWYRSVECGSLLPHTFNLLWIACLDNRYQGFTHFAMHHADIQSPLGWLDTLYEEMERVNADVISVISPIKDDRRLTSCGVRQKNGNIRRLTMKEVKRLPETFSQADVASDDEQLMVNTGLWLARLDRPWVEEFSGFAILSTIGKDKAGQLKAKVLPEDWNWSRFLAERGVRVFATRKIKIHHWGKKSYDNEDATFGLDTDGGDAIKSAMPVIPASADSFPTKQSNSTREIVAVRYAEDMAWVCNWLDDLLVKNGPDLVYRVYDKGHGGDTLNVGNLDWTYLHHIVTRWDDLADWTVFTQADPFPHLVMPSGRKVPFENLLLRKLNEDVAFPFLASYREWGQDGRIGWLSDAFRKQLPQWYHAYRNGSIRPAKLSLREWFSEYIGVDIEELGALEYHPGAIFGVSRDMIQRRPKEFYERLLASLGENKHPSPEEAHYCERAWNYIFR